MQISVLLPEIPASLSCLLLVSYHQPHTTGLGEEEVLSCLESRTARDLFSLGELKLTAKLHEKHTSCIIFLSSIGYKAPSPMKVFHDHNRKIDHILTSLTQTKGFFRP